MVLLAIAQWLRQISQDRVAVDPFFFGVEVMWQAPMWLLSRGMRWRLVGGCPACVWAARRSFPDGRTGDRSIDRASALRSHIGVEIAHRPCSCSAGTPFGRHANCGGTCGGEPAARCRVTDSLWRAAEYRYQARGGKPVIGEGTGAVPRGCCSETPLRACLRSLYPSRARQRVI